MQSRAALLAPPAPSFARYVLWARLWLLRLTGLTGLWPEAHGALKRLTHLFCMMLLIGGAERMRRQRRNTRPVAALGQRPFRPRRLFRRAMGGALRRKLCRGGIGQRICALLNALQDLDAHIAEMHRRIPCGFTRLAPILARRAAFGADARRIASFAPDITPPLRI